MPSSSAQGWQVGSVIVRVATPCTHTLPLPHLTPLGVTPAYPLTQCSRVTEQGHNSPATIPRQCQPQLHILFPQQCWGEQLSEIKGVASGIAVTWPNTTDVCHFKAPAQLQCALVYLPTCLLALRYVVQVIANTGGILGVGPTPHEVLPRPGRSTVDVDGLAFKGPKSPHTKWHKVSGNC